MGGVASCVPTVVSTDSNATNSRTPGGLWYQHRPKTRHPTVAPARGEPARTQRSMLVSEIPRAALVEEGTNTQDKSRGYETTPAPHRLTEADRNHPQVLI